jgi:hypothetical protein
MAAKDDTTLIPDSRGSFFGVSVYPSYMNRRVGLLVIPCCLALLMVGCTRVRELPGRTMALPSPSPSPQPTGGEALVGIPFPQTIFGPPLKTASVQPETMKLKNLILTHPRLKVTALASSHKTVAIGFQEKASGDQRWGEIMIPEERKLFQRFAMDTSLGEWLIVITDVEVTDAPDPVPLVAYRWTRTAVETFEKCGIPQTVTFNRCTDHFYGAAQVVFLMLGGRIGGQ